MCENKSVSEPGGVFGVRVREEHMEVHKYLCKQASLNLCMCLSYYIFAQEGTCELYMYVCQYR